MQQREEDEPTMEIVLDGGDDARMPTQMALDADAAADALASLASMYIELDDEGVAFYVLTEAEEDALWRRIANDVLADE